MNLFTSVFKSKKPSGPYQDEHLNTIYNLLFCDDVELYRNTFKGAIVYPLDILFSKNASDGDLQKIVADANTETRVKILACNLLRKNQQPIYGKELLGVIVEVGLEGGVDTLASYRDGTARYINYTGKMTVWEAKDSTSDAITKKLFTHSEQIVARIGPWDKERRPHPAQGVARLSFLVSDGLYFGEGPMNVLFNDAMASPALNAATELMQFLVEKSLQAEKR